MTLGGHANEVKPAPSKAAKPIDVSASRPVNDVRAEQPRKALEPMDVTAFRPVINVRAEQPQKALLGTSATLGGHANEAKPVLEKA